MNLRELKIEITNQCLLNCVHCSTGAASGLNSFLSQSVIKNLVDQACNLGCREIFFSGGEPLLHPDLDFFLEILASKGIQNKLYTTGIIKLAPPAPISLKELKILKAHGLSQLAFSLYSARPDVHDSITHVSDSFFATVTAIKNAIELDIITEIHFVAMRKLIEELPPLARFVDKLGITKISVLRFVPHGRGKESAPQLTPTTSDFRKLRKIVIALRQEKPNITFRLGSPFNFLLLGSPTPCTTGFDRMIIDADGFAYPCDALKQVKIANQNNNVLRDPILRILEKAPLFQMVRHATIPETCMPCPKVKECFGGCLAQRLLTVGDPSLQTDPGCLRQQSSKPSSHLNENVVSAKTLPRLEEAQWIS